MKTKKILRASGLISATTAILFLAIFLILGFIQPGYNHFSDTISVLIYGKWGWVQNINFIIFAIGLASLGAGLGIYFRRNLISFMSIVFYIVSADVALLAFVPADYTDRQVELQEFSLFGKLHIYLTMILVLSTLILIKQLMEVMKKNSAFRKYTVYTCLVFLTSFVFGSLWFVARKLGILFLWKGLWQKLLAVNLLAWIIIIGKELSDKA